jgi:hypothetical protein
MAEDRTGEIRGSKVRWDDSKARRAHANECNVSTSDGEFLLSFGVSQASPGEGRDFVIALTQRIAMSPYVAKRLAVLLDRVLREHDARYGDGRRAPSTPAKKGDSRGPV